MTPGTMLGSYEIRSELGVGGMGEVYRAKDTKLGREVAVKILPDTFTHDPERLARFRREAQVLASVNHPHIAQIYGLEESNGTQFLVLELVDGESLDKRIARGPIPVDEALGIAKQITEALETAHEKGIIHRDLKPANIALNNDGTVEVLDFGLAKAVESTSGSLDLANSPTITTPAIMTGVGVILGTAAYMSPEQSKGRAADKRSDIGRSGAWSTKCSAASERSRARTSATRLRPSCAANRIGRACLQVPRCPFARSFGSALKRIVQTDPPT
jgi:serine/threonine protein kinase